MFTLKGSAGRRTGEEPAKHVAIRHSCGEPSNNKMANGFANDGSFMAQFMAQQGGGGSSSRTGKGVKNVADTASIWPRGVHGGCRRATLIRAACPCTWAVQDGLYTTPARMLALATTKRLHCVRVS